MSTAPLVDSRKDKSGITTTYKTVQLKDGNIWLAENFNYFVSHDVCQTRVGYRDEMELHRKDGIGLYYGWNAFASNLDLMPAGWHLPTEEEWTAMMDCYGGVAAAFEHLVVGGSSGLNLPFDGGTYFPGEPCRQLAMQGLGMFWTGSESADKKTAAAVYIDDHGKKIDIRHIFVESRLNIRLVKNSTD